MIEFCVQYREVGVMVRFGKWKSLGEHSPPHIYTCLIFNTGASPKKLAYLRMEEDLKTMISYLRILSRKCGSE